jgi:hypothetical protein
MARKKQNFEQVKKKNIPLVYVGATFPNGKLTRFRIYANGVPDHVFQGVKDVIALKKLFVPASELGAAILNVRVQGHPLNVYYKRIEKEISLKEDR